MRNEGKNWEGAGWKEKNEFTESVEEKSKTGVCFTCRPKRKDLQFPREKGLN